MKIERATLIVHAAAVALRPEALPGPQDREQLAHFEFSLFEQFHGCGTAFRDRIELKLLEKFNCGRPCLNDAVKLGNEVHACGQSSLIRSHVFEFQEERACVG